MKKVEWLVESDGGKYPFCPYCHEFAYEEDYCVFCGKEYKGMDRKSKGRMVNVGEYSVVQTSNNHISISKGRRMVCHMQCTKKLSERKLRKQVTLYEKLTEGEGGQNGTIY